MDVLTTLTADKPVVIFSKSTCCMSHTVKALICSFGANPSVIEVDKMASGHQVERALIQLGCRPSVPAVFIGQQFIGGADEVIKLNVQNKLAQLLLRAKAIFIWSRSCCRGIHSPTGTGMPRTGLALVLCSILVLDSHMPRGLTA
ncbi:hypothetical protein VNO78_18015 [Psophocarpus tetragonolobus]|uniref:Glutaredoxin domain-containing protein n=1 Tax=Psophocarpus tetragonolobus TaxID=3891 RepID=A0AAN9XLN7_PSOTE